MADVLTRNRMRPQARQDNFAYTPVSSRLALGEAAAETERQEEDNTALLRFGAFWMSDRKPWAHALFSIQASGGEAGKAPSVRTLNTGLKACWRGWPDLVRSIEGGCRCGEAAILRAGKFARQSRSVRASRKVRAP